MVLIAGIMGDQCNCVRCYVKREIARQPNRQAAAEAAGRLIILSSNDRGAAVSEAVVTGQSASKIAEIAAVAARDAFREYIP